VGCVDVELELELEVDMRTIDRQRGRIAVPLLLLKLRIDGTSRRAACCMYDLCVRCRAAAASTKAARTMWRAVLFLVPSSIGSCCFLLLVACLLGVSLVSRERELHIFISLWLEQFGAWIISLSL